MDSWSTYLIQIQSIQGMMSGKIGKSSLLYLDKIFEGMNISSKYS